MSDPSTIADLIDRALAGYAELASLGEGIEDEWSYVNDLAGAWTARLEAAAAAAGLAAASTAQVAAIEQALQEIAAITDPHRAIDWLSTFPQVVLVAIGERP